jgi:hypothetical protein
VKAIEPTLQEEAHMRSDTRTISLNTPAEHAFEFLAEPLNLSRWAVGFCHSIRPGEEPGAWWVTTSQGEVGLRLRTDRELGIIDFILEPAAGAQSVAYSRVLAAGDGAAEYVFTQFQAPGMPDDVFAAQVEALREELSVLKSILRAKSLCPA